MRATARKQDHESRARIPNHHLLKRLDPDLKVVDLARMLQLDRPQDALKLDIGLGQGRARSKSANDVQPVARALRLVEDIRGRSIEARVCEGIFEVGWRDADDGVVPVTEPQ